MSRISHFLPTVQALLAALLFGASAPAVKFMLGKIEPIPLATLLLIGSGPGLRGVQLLRRVMKPAVEAEGNLKRTDLPWLTGAIFTYA